MNHVLLPFDECDFCPLPTPRTCLLANIKSVLPARCSCCSRPKSSPLAIPTRALSVLSTTKMTASVLGKYVLQEGRRLACPPRSHTYVWEIRQWGVRGLGLVEGWEAWHTADPTKAGGMDCYCVESVRARSLAHTHLKCQVFHLDLLHVAAYCRLCAHRLPQVQLVQDGGLARVI